jgi:site-specific recombinase XerD
LGVKNEIGDFLDYLTYRRNVSPNTIIAYRDDLESFTAFSATTLHDGAR